MVVEIYEHYENVLIVFSHMCYLLYDICTKAQLEDHRYNILYQLHRAINKIIRKINIISVNRNL